MDTATLVAGLTDLPLYRVRTTSSDPGYLFTGFGRRLRSAFDHADRTNAIGGGLVAVVEAYDRHTGLTLRTLEG